MDNARKYTPAGGKIKLLVKGKDGRRISPCKTRALASLQKSSPASLTASSGPMSLGLGPLAEQAWDYPLLTGSPTGMGAY